MITQFIGKDSVAGHKSQIDLYLRKGIAYLLFPTAKVVQTECRGKLAWTHLPRRRLSSLVEAKIRQYTDLPKIGR